MLLQPRAWPFVKWRGGKRNLAAEIIKHLPESCGRYYEPFVGGGALFFALRWRLDQITLSDLNDDLINAWRVVKHRPKWLINRLYEHKNRHCKSYYITLRTNKPTDSAERGAWFIYLMRACFNGSYSVNNQGRFNSAYGGDDRREGIVNIDRIMNCHQCLQGVDLRTGAYTIIRPKYGDVVYCDPPYVSTQQYTPSPFTETDHRILANLAKQWRRSGAHVVISNSDTQFVRDLYSGFKQVEVQAHRRHCSDPLFRNKVQELLLVGGAAGVS